MQLHPLFSFKYKLDIQIPRIYKFIVLYTRLMIIMGGTFLFLRNSSILDTDPQYGLQVFLVIVYIFIASLLLVPIPIFLYSFCLKSKYYLSNTNDDE